MTVERIECGDKCILKGPILEVQEEVKRLAGLGWIPLLGAETHGDDLFQTMLGPGELASSPIAMEIIKDTAAEVMDRYPFGNAE